MPSLGVVRVDHPFVKRTTFDPREGDNLYFPYLEKPRSFAKLAAEMHPEIQRWLHTWKPHPDFPVVVIAPMGSSEFWSQNSNGDLWPEEQLNPPDGARDYGYRTFEQASLYSHHCFPAGSRVRLSSREEKPIEQVQEGDVVLTSSGGARVSGVFQRPYEGPGVRLELQGLLDDLVATVDHPVFAYRREQIHCRHGYVKTQNTEHSRTCRECQHGVGVPQEVPAESLREDD